MRKPRDFDSELKVLADKAKALKERRVRQWRTGRGNWGGHARR